MKKIRVFALDIVLIVIMITITGCKLIKVEDDGTYSDVASKNEGSLSKDIGESENESTGSTSSNTGTSTSTGDTNAKFSKADLVVNNLKVGMTEEEVKNVLGDPDRVENGESVDIYGDSISYFYGDLQLGFYKHNGQMVLSDASTTSSDYTFAKGLKVGDSAEKVKSSFYRESDSDSGLRDVFSEYDFGTPYGKYLYGHGIDTTDAVKESGKLQYAVINKYNYDYSRPGATYMIEYSYFEPPYLYDYATIADERMVLVFDVDSTDTVTCIRWYYYPEMV